MTTKLSNLITVGRITGVFGIKGWLKVKSSTEPEEQIVNYSPWWLKTRYGVKKMEIDDYLFRPQGTVVHIKGMDDRNQAEELGKVEIAVEKQQLPALEDGDYYWYQLVGLQVISEFNGQHHHLGCIDKILETGANDVLVVKPNSASEEKNTGTGIEVESKERLVPYVPETYVKNIDLQAGTMLVEWDPDF